MSFEKIESFFGKIFIFVVVSILTFLFLDFLSLKYFSTRSPIEEQFSVQLVRHPKPYTMFGGIKNSGDADLFGRKIQLNDFGYRGNAPSMPKPKDEFRIIMLGGSTVMAGNPPISGLLEREFKLNGQDNVKVYNFGVLSSVSGMELARIVFEVSELDADLVIMYNGGNDILSNLSWDPRPGYPYNFIAYEYNPLLESEVETYPAVTLFLYGSNMLRYLMRPYFVQKFIPLEKIREESKWKTDEWENEIVDVYVNNLLKSRKITQAFGAEFMVVFQPLLYYIAFITEKEQGFLNGKEQTEYVHRMRQKILNKVERVKEEDPKLKFINLSDIFTDQQERVYRDDIHTRQFAKTMVAQAIYAQISENWGKLADSQ